MRKLGVVFAVLALATAAFAGGADKPATAGFTKVSVSELKIQGMAVDSPCTITNLNFQEGFVRVEDNLDSTMEPFEVRTGDLTLKVSAERQEHYAGRALPAELLNRPDSNGNVNVSKAERFWGIVRVAHFVIADSRNKGHGAKVKETVSTVFECLPGDAKNKAIQIKSKPFQLEVEVGGDGKFPDYQSLAWPHLPVEGHIQLIQQEISVDGDPVVTIWILRTCRDIRYLGYKPAIVTPVTVAAK